MRSKRQTQEDENELLTYIGLERLRSPPRPSGRSDVYLHQISYAKAIVAEYVKTRNKGQQLRSVDTPIMAREDGKEDVPQGVPDLIQGG